MKHITKSLAAIAIASVLCVSNAYASTNGSRSSVSPPTVRSSNFNPSSVSRFNSGKSPAGVTVKVGRTWTVKQLQNYVCLAANYFVKHPPRASFDTSGFVQYVYSKIGVKLPRTILDQSRAGKKIYNRTQLQKGDLVFFNLSTPSNSEVTFDGIYVGNRTFVALTTHGLEAIPMQSGYWKGKFKFGVRIL